MRRTKGEILFSANFPNAKWGFLPAAETSRSTQDSDTLDFEAGGWPRAKHLRRAQHAVPLQNRFGR
jgi:hypothetical protein